MRRRGAKPGVVADQWQERASPGPCGEEADGGAVTLIQRFGSAANLNIHLHCLVLDGVYRRTDGDPVFVEVSAPSDEALQALLHKIISRLMKLLTRRGVLVEEAGSSYLADGDADSDDARTLRPLQAAACTYRIAFGPRAGQKVFTVQGAMPRRETPRARRRGQGGVHHGVGAWMPVAGK